MARRERINWTKVLSHPKDYLCTIDGESKVTRRHEHQYSNSSDESDGRVCTIAHAGVFDLGYDNARSNPARQAIVYNKVTHKWEHAPSVISYSRPVTQVSNLVKASTKQAINRHKGGSV